MEYEFRGQGMAEVKGQFMLGKKYMVARVIMKENRRTIQFPKGTWKSDEAKIIKGPKLVEQNAASERLSVFELLTNK